MDAATMARAARLKAGLSCRGLAARAGVSATTICRIEDGEMDPTYTMLERVLGAAGQQLRSTCSDLDDRPSLARLADGWEPGPRGPRLPWTRLRGFVDWRRRHPDLTSAAIATPPARRDPVLDVLLAGMAEKIADDAGLPRPRWTEAVPPLDDPWEPPGTPRMVATARREAPEQFRRRNLFLAERDIWRHSG